MYPKKLEELSARQLAVIEYLYDLSRPSLAERAVRGLSHFMRYVAKAAHGQDMLVLSNAQNLEGELGIFSSEDALIEHVFELAMQKVLAGDVPTSDTNPYVAPLIWPPAVEGEEPVHMNRFMLYMHLVALVFGEIEGVHEDEVMTATRELVRRELKSAIRGHYARHRTDRGRKA
ncbi:MAG: hypothetical protein JJU15_20625 [Pararhodobacter sp.]|nr:hypothetical protein [Pararhodobacter sp.]